MHDVDMSVLAQLMLEWEKTKRLLEEIEAIIKGDVLQIGKTQTVGNVRATYSKGRRRYDYQAAIERADLPPGSLGPFEQVSVDYRGACKEFDIEDVPFTQSGPSVSVKLLN